MDVIQSASFCTTMPCYCTHTFFSPSKKQSGEKKRLMPILQKSGINVYVEFFLGGIFLWVEYLILFVIRITLWPFFIEI